jgi:hypothetical protein
MAGRGAPSFLKRQKEMNHIARANEKRAARQARRDDRSTSDAAVDEFEPLSPPVPDEPAPAAETDPTDEPPPHPTA